MTRTALLTFSGALVLIQAGIMLLVSGAILLGGIAVIAAAPTVLAMIAAIWTMFIAAIPVVILTATGISLIRGAFRKRAFGVVVFALAVELGLAILFAYVGGTPYQWLSLIFVLPLIGALFTEGFRSGYSDAARYSRSPAPQVPIEHMKTAGPVKSVRR